MTLTRFRNSMQSVEIEKANAFALGGGEFLSGSQRRSESVVTLQAKVLAGRTNNEIDEVDEIDHSFIRRKCDASLLYTVRVELVGHGILALVALPILRVVLSHATLPALVDAVSASS